MEDKINIYPFKEKPSRILRRNIRSKSIKVNPKFIGGEVTWDNIKDKKWPELLNKIKEDIPTKDVYISVDKDCLLSEYAYTNWEPGEISLPFLVEAIKAIKTEFNLIGADITGDYSVPQIETFPKRIFYNFDHLCAGKKEKYLSETSSINSRTNIILSQVFLGLDANIIKSRLS